MWIIFHCVHPPHVGWSSTQILMCRPATQWGWHLGEMWFCEGVPSHMKTIPSVNIPYIVNKKTCNYIAWCCFFFHPIWKEKKWLNWKWFIFFHSSQKDKPHSNKVLFQKNPRQLIWKPPKKNLGQVKLTTLATCPRVYATFPPQRIRQDTIANLSFQLSDTIQQLTCLAGRQKKQQNINGWSTLPWIICVYTYIYI